MTAGAPPGDAPVLDYSLGGGKILGGGTNALGRGKILGGGNVHLPHYLATPLDTGKHDNICQDTGGCR